MLKSFLEGRRQRRQQLEDDNRRQAEALERGRQMGIRVAEQVDGLLTQLVQPWAAQLLDAFTKRVAVEAIFSDDPAPDARAELARFNAAVDEQLEFIKADVRGHLRETEAFCKDLGMVDAYEDLLRSRFGEIRLQLTMGGMNTAADVVIARRAEMGFAEEAGEPLENGRQILATARDMKIPLV